MSNTSLRFDPDLDNLIFNDNSASLTVSNESSQGMICKIQATPENCYEINQAHFFLLPSLKVVVIIAFYNNTDDDDRSDDVINVQWLPINENNGTENAENYWKQTSKTRRKQITTRPFGCEFKTQDALSKSDRAIIPVEALQKVDLDKSIEKFGEMAIDSHTTVTELNSEFNSLIERMEKENAQQLNDIIKVLREIATQYKHLENETRSAVRQTEKVLLKVIDAVSSRKLKPSQKIQVMKQDFSVLAAEFGRLAKCHGCISQQLAMEADKAETAKKNSDARAEKAEELKEHAQVLGILGTPGAGFASSVYALTNSAANSVDQPIIKALASVGGVLGGIIVGTAVTVGSPILLTIAAVLAVKSKAWSTKFDSMHDMIRKLEDIMKTADQCLTDIKSDLNMLSHDTSQVEQNKDSTMLDYGFDRVKHSCESVMESCRKYIEVADANKTTMKQIKKS